MVVTRKQINAAFDKVKILSLCKLYNQLAPGTTLDLNCKNILESCRITGIRNQVLKSGLHSG